MRYNRPASASKGLRPKVVHLDRDLAAQVVRLADDAMVSRSELMREAIRHGLDAAHKAMRKRMGFDSEDG